MVKKVKERTVKEYNLPSEKVNAIPIGEHEVAPFRKYERADLKEGGNLKLNY
jgi:hypothetical protein